MDENENDDAVEVITPDQGVEVLKAQIEREKAARIAAEEHARRMAFETTQARQEVHETNVSLVDTAIDRLSQEADILEAGYAEALMNGDVKSAAKIQRQMTETAVKINNLETGRESPKNTPPPAASAPPADPVEAFARQLTPKSASWVRAHPEYVTNPSLQQQMIGADSIVQARGVQPDTPEYFAEVEKILGISRQDEEDAPPARRNAPPAAPGNTGGGSNGKTRRLSAAQLEAAELSGLSPEEYVKQMDRIEREQRGQKVH